jgi:U4/U6 small nuclear ribonucleoprotein PRP31
MSKLNTIALHGLDSLSDEEDIYEEISLKQLPKDEKVKSVLLTDPQFKQVLDQIDHEKMHHKEMYINFNISIEFISECNRYISDVDHEISLLTRYIKEFYSQRFPELEAIILSPYTYALTVKRLGNDLDITKNDLSDILPNNNIMSINMMSSTTSGKPLKKDVLADLLRLCDEVISLVNNKTKILSFIENKISTIAPNLTALLGPNVAAKLVTAAGGLQELSKIPACNVLVLGAQRVNTEGFSTAGKLHRGYLAELDEVKNTPEEFQIQLLRKYANKSVLAARVDTYRKVINTKDDLVLNTKEVDQSKNNIKEVNNEIDAADGKRLKEFIGKKMDRIKEPKAAALKKPLPRPDDKPRRKRGGKRVKNIKQRMALTEMRALKNRMSFGPDAESEFRETGVGYGMLNQAGKVKVSTKKVKFNTKKQNQAFIQSQAEQQKSGLYSTVSLTQQEGMRLINPELLENRLDATKARYFNATSGFTTVINSKKKGSDNLLNLNK